MSEDSNWWASTPPSQTTGLPLDGTTGTANLGSGSITALADEWLKARTELRAVQKRIDDLTTAIIDQVGIKDEGSKTETVGNYKITTTQNINYAISEEDAYGLLESGVVSPTLFQEVFKQRLSLSKTNYREVLALEPIAGNAIQGCLTSKKGKPAVKIELTKED